MNRYQRALLATLCVGALMMAACSPADDEGAEQVEAESTATPAAAEPVPEETAADAADADTAGDDAETEAAQTEAADVAALPEGDTEITIGHPSDISVYDAISIVHADRLNEQGWTIENVEFAQTTLNTQALVEGQLEIAVATYGEPLRFIADDAGISLVMENNGGEFGVAARADIESCEDLGGQRYGIHGETSSVALISLDWIRNECGAEPDVLVLPGGDNRAVALANGELDAAQVQMSDFVNLDLDQPGEFHLLEAGDTFDPTGAGWFINDAWAEENPEAAARFFAELLITFQMIHEDPQPLIDVLIERLDYTQDQAELSIETYFDVVEAWPTDGGGSDTALAAMNTFVENGELEETIPAEEFHNTALLEEARALAEELQ